jgi:two-component system chemotaxis response regulator CheB
MQGKNHSSKKIKVLIADDSLVTQKLYRYMLESDPQFEVVGVVNNGREALEFLKTHHVDIVSMDINMPLMDGLEATKWIMQSNPVPVLIASSLYDPTQQEMAMQALEAGAVAIMPKPYGPGHVKHEKSFKNWLQMLRTLSEVRVVRRTSTAKNHNPSQLTAGDTAPFPADKSQQQFRLIVIGASAGGPEAIKTLLSHFPANFPLPILIVQHIDKHFTEGYRMWLQTFTSLPVILATSNQAMQPGTVYLAPGEHHLVVKREGYCSLNTNPPIRGHQPSVAALFESVAAIYGEKVIAVILSGMGADGARELKLLRNKGALTFAQNEESCLVYGMPGEAVRMDAATVIANPREIALKILNATKE